MVFRLYLVDRITGKSTGKKRDYPSMEHFIKYGVETYNRYNESYYFSGRINETKAKLCFLNENNKWEEVTEEIKKELGI